MGPSRTSCYIWKSLMTYYIWNNYYTREMPTESQPPLPLPLATSRLPVGPHASRPTRVLPRLRGPRHGSAHRITLARVRFATGSARLWAPVSPHYSRLGSAVCERALCDGSSTSPHGPWNLARPLNCSTTGSHAWPSCPTPLFCPRSARLASRR